MAMEYTKFEQRDMLLTLGVCDSRAGIHAAKYTLRCYCQRTSDHVLW
jgi:hypothetical protein